MRPRARLVLAAGAVLAASLAAGARGDHLEHSFAVSPGGRLTVSTDVGDLEVRTGPSDRVLVTVDRSVEGVDVTRATELLRELTVDFRQDGNDVTVEGRLPSGHSQLRDGFHHRGRLRVRIVATVPRRFDLTVETSGGDVTAPDLDGTVSARTAGGDLRLGAISGSVSLETAGGDVEVGAIGGPGEVHTAGGDIRLGHAGGRLDVSTSGGDVVASVVAGPVVASTAGGDISVSFAAPPAGEVRLQSSGGDLALALPAGIAATIDAKTSGGEISSDVPIAFSGRIYEGNLEGTIGGGGPLLHLRTAGGDITLHQTSAAAVPTGS